MNVTVHRVRLGAPSRKYFFLINGAPKAPLITLKNETQHEVFGGCYNRPLPAPHGNGLRITARRVPHRRSVRCSPCSFL